MSTSSHTRQERSPYTDFSREQWSALRDNTPQVLTEDEVNELQGIGDNISLDEVSDIYLPLSRLINLRMEAHSTLHETTERFLSERIQKVPFIIGVTGSVAAGKTTTARLLQVLLQRWNTSPTVDLITTDGFLYPTQELVQHGTLGRKGFPESYDQRAMLGFLSSVKAGQTPVSAPVYSHATYDRVPDEEIIVQQPNILIVEGLNVLQNGPGSLMASDFLDFSIYVDAHVHDIEQWYLDRFLQLKNTAFQDPDAYFHHYASFSDADAVKVAREIWNTVNLPNLVEYVEPTRARASLILQKGADHSVEMIKLRKN